MFRSLEGLSQQLKGMVMPGSIIDDSRESVGIATNLSRFGLDHRHLVDSLIVAPQTTVDLSTQDDRDSAIKPILINTDRLDVFKSWIGSSDVVVASDPALANHYQLPGAEWNGRRLSDSGRLSAEEISEIEKACRVYLFGDSSRVESYRQVIEFLYAPFVAAVYAVRKVTIKSGGRLVVTGKPTILLFDELELFSPGVLVTYTVCNASIGRFQKKEGKE